MHIYFNMTTSTTKIGELEEIHKIVQSTLDFYNTTFRSAGFNFGGKFEVINKSIELKYYLATPYYQLVEQMEEVQYYIHVYIT